MIVEAVPWLTTVPTPPIETPALLQPQPYEAIVP